MARAVVLWQQQAVHSPAFDGCGRPPCPPASNTWPLGVAQGLVALASQPEAPNTFQGAVSFYAAEPRLLRGVGATGSTKKYTYTYIHTYIHTYMHTHVKMLCECAGHTK